MRYNPETNKQNKPISKVNKTKEDLINEAKLALEAKAITSKAVIAEIEKMDKAPSVGNKRPLSIKMSRSPSRSMRSTRSTRYTGSTGYLSRVLMNRKKNKNATKKINKNKNKNKNNKNNISNEDLLLIQNEFTPSNMATNVTDEKLYSK